MTIAIGATVLAPDEELKVEAVEMVASRHPRPEEEEAYERVLGDAITGDPTHFAREDYVEEAWRIVDPILKAGIPVYAYEQTPGDRVRWTRQFCLLEAGITRPQRTKKTSVSLHRSREKCRWSISIVSLWYRHALQKLITAELSHQASITNVCDR